MKDWCVYVLRCFDGTLYTGATNDVVERLKKHNAGRGAKYTKTRRPVVLLAVSGDMPKPDALRFERKVKKMRKQDKVEAVGGYKI